MKILSTKKQKESLTNIIYNIWIDVQYPFRQFFTNIKNIIYWLPIIWSDRDWDHGYLTKMQLAKMKKMLKWFSNPKNTHIIEESRKHICSRLTTAIKLMELIYVEDFYELEYFDIAEKQYGKWHFKSVPFVDEENPREDLYELVTEYERSYTPEEIKVIEKNVRELMHKGREKNKKAKRILWAFIEHNIDYWWD